MTTNIRKTLCTALVLALVLSGQAAVFAGRALPEGLLIGDENGIAVEKDGGYFIEASGLVAGDIITKKLEITNFDPKYSFVLSMTSEPMESSGPVNLLDMIHLTLTLDNRQIYDGSVRGDGNPDMTRDPLPLGEYAYGRRSVLTIVLRVSDDLRPTWTPSEAVVGWQFYAVRFDTTGVDTGDHANPAVLAAACALSGGLIAVVVIRRSHENRKHPSDAATRRK